MASSVRSRTALILPLVLLTVALLEDVTLYKVRQHLHDPRLLVGLTILAKGALFSVAAGWVSPWIKAALSTARHSSHRGAGALGLWVFYAGAYGAIYWAYWLVERGGPGALLPAAWR